MAENECRDKILSHEFWDFLIPLYREEELEGIQPERFCIQEMDFGYKTAYVDSRIHDPLTIERYWYNSIPQCYVPLDMQPLSHAGIIRLQNYPTFQLLGQGIMIGFVDTGIDYRNRVFRNLDGTTRIAGIWDQTLQEGTPPAEILYGSAYTESMINEALQLDNPLERVPSTDENGHGTYIASVAAGGADIDNQFIGAAPEATIAVVKLKPAKKYLKEFYAIHEDALCFQENDVMTALKYLNMLARERKMPLVVCVALGTNFGGHNGTSLLSTILDRYSMIMNRSVVIGTGNEAALRHHYHHQFRDLKDVDSVEIRVGDGVSGFVAELWSTLPTVVTVSVVSPSGERTGNIPFRLGARYQYLFSFERTMLTIESRLLQENNDSQLVFIRFENVVSGIWKIEVTPLLNEDGDFHIWLPIKGFLEGEVYFLEADPDHTITEPGSCRAAMTAAYYNSFENGVDINSGRGYTRDGLIKPDFAVPGVEITGVRPDGRFTDRTGSSGATAIAAGGAALMMNWILVQPQTVSVSSSQVRNIIIMGADRRPEAEYPNREWGYGTMNLYRSLDILRQL